MVATICPSECRDQKDQEALQTYRKDMSDISELPGVIAEVASLMGLDDLGGSIGSAFALDALRIEVSGPTGLHLTVVDLPGLITVVNEEQSEEDIQTVHRLVEGYLDSSRTIILAVVQASNDIANQPIVQKARRFDPDGLRTVGIITKPDLVNKGTEYRIARLANNEDNVKLKLGFFMLKNPSPADLAAGKDLHAWSSDEAEFFARPPWRDHDLDVDRLGAVGLRTYLQDLLHEHIEREIPMVKEELKGKLLDAESRLLKLGNPRPTLNDIRSFMIELSMRFHQLVQDSLRGHYHDADLGFFREETRLRALIHQLNTRFAEDMRLFGSTRTVISQNHDWSEGSPKRIQTERFRVTQEGMLAWVKEVYVGTRGLELPGNYNHSLLSELFHVQSRPWLDIASTHLNAIEDAVGNWLRQTLASVVYEEHLRRELVALCMGKLQKTASRAHEEVDRLWADEQRHPVTYNHYYTDNVQKASLDHQEEAVQGALSTLAQRHWRVGGGGARIDSEDVAKVSATVRDRVIVNMDDRACKEALEGMQAYYKVSIKTFVDNVCRQVVERHFLVSLPTFFSPHAVSSMSDDELLRIGSESETKRATREKYASLVECMRESLAELSISP